MTLHLNGIDVDCVIGDLPYERACLQRLQVDVRVEVDDVVATSDMLTDTADYVSLVNGIRNALSAASCRMIERAARIAAEACLADAHVRSAAATVTKIGSVPHLQSAAATWEASR